MSSTDNQGKPVGRPIRGPNGSHKNHSALSGEQCVDVQGVLAQIHILLYIYVPQVLYSGGAGSMSNDNDEQSIGNTIRGPNVSQPGFSEQSVPEGTAFKFWVRFA